MSCVCDHAKKLHIGVGGACTYTEGDSYCDCGFYTNANPATKSVAVMAKCANHEPRYQGDYYEEPSGVRMQTYQCQSCGEVTTQEAEDA